MTLEQEVQIILDYLEANNIILNEQLTRADDISDIKTAAAL
jgi:hypothetical protein